MKTAATIIAVLLLLPAAGFTQDAKPEKKADEKKEATEKSDDESFEGLDLTDAAEEEEAGTEAPKDETEPPLLDLSTEPETPASDEEKPETKPETKPGELTNILVVFKLTSDEAAADVIDLVNAEVHMVLDSAGKYQLLASEDLAEGRDTHPDTALGYCNEDPECIATIVADKQAHWVLFGNLKKSFDGTLILARLILLDVAKVKVEAEKFGQFKIGDENLVVTCGNLVREMIGLEVVKPKPKPKPLVAKVDKPAELTKTVKKTQPPEPAGPWSNPWTWTLAGVGVASLAGGIALGVMSNNKVDDASHPGFDQPAAYGIIQDAEDLALGANIAFGLGGAALAGAVVLFIIDSTSEAPKAAPAVACSGSGCRAIIFGRF